MREEEKGVLPEGFDFHFDHKCRVVVSARCLDFSKTRTVKMITGRLANRSVKKTEYNRNTINICLYGGVL